MLSQPEHYCCQSHHRQVVVRPFLVAGCHPTKLFEAQNATLYDIALGILGLHKHDRTPALTAFLGPLLPLVAPLRDQMLDAASTQSLPTTRITIAFVVAQFTRPLAGTP